MTELFREITSRFRSGVTRLVARLISEHIRRIREAAYREGEIKGLKKGRVIGKQEGFAEGRLVYDVIELLRWKLKRLMPDCTGRRG
ncbi:hypothetical protein [Xanthomonas hawaiiensis]|uniref:hypothetical protein n=1 Tax=Xanthomonas hawaiiensis TaxID=3003247 RepID=UPI002880487E|nr:hypothetical protein [Xanthomonas sp. A6251]WNH43831.1 hypothetical protein PG878_15065 [Xanthomonas sp. A6251]